MKSKFYQLLCVLAFTFNGTAYASEGWNFALIGGPGTEVPGTQWIPGESLFPVYGIAAGYLFPSRYEIGAEFEMTGTVPTFGIDGNYYFTHEIFAGVQFGADFTTFSEVYLGPQLGFDYVISPGITIGPELQYLYIFKEGGGLLEILGSLKFFF
ncbi:MAG: hypothetical protein ABIQ95_16190 [Bdellovibrionia bacterium]